IESIFLYPRIVGKMVGLYPVVIMIMLLILSRFWGIFGLFLGVPISALLWYFIDRKLRPT
ncbi:MAG TPA: AI-2E family transporter, partial [Firmicutes bacterium]|nr:AI-2E family transporter [Bacillota bacterium]